MRFEKKIWKTKIKNPLMNFNFLYGECRIMFRNTLLATAKQRDSLLVLETIRPYSLYRLFIYV